MNSLKGVRICGLTKTHASFTLHAQTRIPAPSGAPRKHSYQVQMKTNADSNIFCSMLRLNSSRPGGDHVSVLKIDEPGKDGLFGLHTLRTVGYKGVTSAGSLDVHGFDVEALDDSRLRFWMINHRPPVDEKNIVLDANKLGANSTIEVFEVTRGSSEMVHFSTISSEVIATPNKVAAVGDGGVLMTNDHNQKSEESYHSQSPDRFSANDAFDSKLES